MGRGEREGGGMEGGRELKRENGGFGIRSHSWIAVGAEPNAHQFKCHDLLIKGDEWK
jgi:hypothetical protein